MKKAKKQYVPLWVRVKTGCSDWALGIAVFFSLFTFGPRAQKGILDKVGDNKKVAMVAIVAQVVFLAGLLLAVLAVVVAITGGSAGEA